MSEDEYLALERASDEKHEFVNGELIAMAGASARHNLIAGNVIRALGNRLAGRCLVFPSDQRVHTRTTSLYAYPDVTVVCGRPEFHPKDGLVVVNPSLLVEVLSETTEAWDRGAKAAHYRQLPSLQAYVLVSQAERRVEIFRRGEHGEWILSEYQDDAVAVVPPLGIELPLDEVYRGVELLAPPAP